MQQSQSTESSYWLFVLPLFFLNFFVVAEHLIVVPLGADISTDTGLAIVRSGILVAVYPLASAVSAFLTAPFSDRFGRKKVLVVFCVGFALSTAAFASSVNVLSVIMFRILCGLFGGPVPSNLMAYVGDCRSGKARTRMVTLIVLAFSVASVLAVPIGATLGDIFFWRVPFYIISGCILLCLLFILRMESVKTGAESGKISKQYREFFDLLKLSRVRKIFLVQFFMIIGLFSIIPNLAAWLNMNFGFDASQIGFCYMQGGIGGIIGNTLSGYFLNRGFKSSIISVGSMIMFGFLVIAGFGIWTGPWIGFFFAGLMFGGSFRMPALQIILTELLPMKFRGRLMSMSMIVNNITMGLGGLVVMPFLSVKDNRLVGMDTVSLVASLSLLVVPFLVLSLKRDIQKQQAVY